MTLGRRTLSRRTATILPGMNTRSEGSEGRTVRHGKTWKASCTWKRQRLWWVLPSFLLRHGISSQHHDRTACGQLISCGVCACVIPCRIFLALASCAGRHNLPRARLVRRKAHVRWMALVCCGKTPDVVLSCRSIPVIPPASV